MSCFVMLWLIKLHFYLFIFTLLNLKLTYCIGLFADTLQGQDAMYNDIYVKTNEIMNWKQTLSKSSSMNDIENLDTMYNANFVVTSQSMMWK